MKNLTIALCTLVSLNAFGSEELYTALNVSETAVDAPRTELVYQKSVGGITCQKTVLLTEEVKFACAIVSDLCARLRFTQA